MTTLLELIRGWMATVGTFINDVLDSLANMTWYSFAERWSQIQQVFSNPRENPQMLLAFGGLGVLVLLALATFIVLVFLSLRAREYEEEYEYVFVDEAGNETVVQTDEPIADLIKKPDPLRWYKRILLTLASLLGLWLLFGFATQTNAVCTSCHVLDASNQAMVLGGHSDIACTACHEPGNVVQRTTVNLFPRLMHTLGGIRTDTASTVRTYQRVSSSACLSCHPLVDLEGVVVSADNRIRMSHREPLEAGMSCTMCHVYTDAQARRQNFNGMSACITCHDGQRVEATCTTCHVVRPTTASRTQPSPDNAQALLAWVDPQQGCYGCHDPGPCDACHGLRIPHTPEFMDITEPSFRLHAEATRRIGAQRCIACHISTSPSGIKPCTECHGGTETNPTFP